jgi:hypothetical protein
MKFDEISEADEVAFTKKTALENLQDQVIKNESEGIVAMYERAAWRAGATVRETETTIREAIRIRSIP